MWPFKKKKEISSNESAAEILFTKKIKKNDKGIQNRRDNLQDNLR